MGILDTIITNKQTEVINDFKPEFLVQEILKYASDRDKDILIKRFGLSGLKQQTLATVGQHHSLTRERVRQIEKDIIKQLKRHSITLEEFHKVKDFLLGIIHSHGKVISENKLFEFLDLKQDSEKNAMVFLLNMVAELDSFLHANQHKCWMSLVFKKELLQKFNETALNIFEKNGKPLNLQEFITEFKNSPAYSEFEQEITEKIIENFLHLSHKLDQNVFGKWGLSKWKDIKPKDVGDKAYLSLKHSGKPEHYSQITEMINRHNFDKRKAYKETVHNELIKDNRFVLVGRGIYALSEWGYKPGVVSDVIASLLKEKGPLSKETILEEVSKKRLVKKNTILVSLSNKKLFLKVNKNRFTLATQD